MSNDERSAFYTSSPATQELPLKGKPFSFHENLLTRTHLRLDFRAYIVYNKD